MNNLEPIGNCGNCDNWVPLPFGKGMKNPPGDCHRYPKTIEKSSKSWCREYYNPNRARQILKEIREGKL